MLRRYGIIGLILIFLLELNFFFKIQPFANWYFPLIWLSYILVIDSVIYNLKKRSWINNHFWGFVGVFILSAFFWYGFEALNVFVRNWNYIGSGALGSGVSHSIFRFLSFSTVLPALLETYELILALRIFDGARLKSGYKITSGFLYGMIGIGIGSFFAPILFPAFAFPLVWLSFFFILDPINYLNSRPSIIGHLQDKNLKVPLSLLLAGIVLGFLWEFWNYWAVIKWTYSIPYVGFFKIFEMPILGYFGYFPFAFELYAMYWFARGLFVDVEKGLG